MSFSDSKHKWILVTLPVWLALNFLLVSSASAHGGEGDHPAGSTSAWLIGLTYIQLIMIPSVGVWLLREAAAAWWKQ